MSAMKIMLVSMLAFAVPVMVTAGYYYQASRSSTKESESPPKGKVLFFTSPS